jgi:hypothetical protein
MPIDYRDYPDNWRSEIVPAIRRRSGNCCEGSPAYPACRAVNEKPHPVTGSRVVLTVAHMDHDHTNNNYHPTNTDDPDNNLRHLCQRCHLQHDIKQHITNRKYGRYWKRNQLTLFNGTSSNTL